VPEDLPDDGGIVQCGDQAQPAPAMGTRQYVDAEGPVHQRRPCPPPLVLYRLHYHDFTRIHQDQDFAPALDALKKDLVRAMVGEPRYRSFVDRLVPLDFESFLGSKRRGFVGRGWLFEKVEAFASKFGRPGTAGGGADGGRQVVLPRRAHPPQPER